MVKEFQAIKNMLRSSGSLDKNAAVSPSDPYQLPTKLPDSGADFHNIDQSLDIEGSNILDAKPCNDEKLLQSIKRNRTVKVHLAERVGI